MSAHGVWKNPVFDATGEARPHLGLPASASGGHRRLSILVCKGTIGFVSMTRASIHAGVFTTYFLCVQHCAAHSEGGEKTEVYSCVLGTRVLIGETSPGVPLILESSYFFTL